jgi:hypothetical protein
MTHILLVEHGVFREAEKQRLILPTSASAQVKRLGAGPRILRRDRDEPSGRSIIMAISCAWLLFALPDSVTQAFAQLAPTGEHYAGRPSDTGHGGTVVDATGTFATAIPLELPPARGDLPIPLQITYGARVGALGLGWDLPLSYIQRDRTFAYRRPASGPGALPEPRERAYLSLFGQRLELMHDDNAWVARSGTLELIVRESAGSWLAYDGMGRTYIFQRPAELGSTGLWLLKSVTAAGSASLQLTYQITTWPLDGGHGIAIDLLRIDYNMHPAEGCAKNEIALTYGYGSITPLSMSILGDKILVRKNALTVIDVNSRSGCDKPYQRLRRYEFQYLPDPDTQLPRLRSSRMFGRQGTPEENTAMPIGTYDYGSATQFVSATQTRTLRYEKTQTIDLPAGVLPRLISGTALDASVNAPVAGDRYAMWQTLTDVTGDGRPDLIFQKDDKLWVAFNRPGSGATTTLGVGGQGLAQLSDSTFANGAFSTHTTASRRYEYGAANRNTTNVWRQAIDVNGDGRIDIIDAAEEPDHWAIYLNTSGGPTGVKWERRSFSVKSLREALVSSGHDIEGPYVPLSRRATGINVKTWDCWLYDGVQWLWWSQGFSTHACPGTENEILDRGPERTFVEWEFTDLNGDGYPDFIFNSSPVQFQLNQPSKPDTHGCCPIASGENWHRFEPRKNNEVRVSYNVVGVRFDTNNDPFAQSVNLRVPDRWSGVEGPVSLSQWRCTGARADTTTCDENSQNQYSGFADVNGDGLLDYVVGNRAYLGAYPGTGFAISTVYITLPDIKLPSGIMRQGSLAVQENTHKKQCAVHGGGKPTVNQTQGLRDLTGDGIPDYYHESSGVWIGTGTGFVEQPIGITTMGADFGFSHQTESCNGSFSFTDGGLFDIDGDGRPDVIGLLENTIVVSQLAGGRAYGRPEAGRITELDNGYGAKTNVTYVSAKSFTAASYP